MNKKSKLNLLIDGVEAILSDFNNYEYDFDSGEVHLKPTAETAINKLKLPFIQKAEKINASASKDKVNTYGIEIAKRTHLAQLHAQLFAHVYQGHCQRMGIEQENYIEAKHYINKCSPLDAAIKTVMAIPTIGCAE